MGFTMKPQLQMSLYLCFCFAMRERKTQQRERWALHEGERDGRKRLCVKERESG